MAPDGNEGGTGDPPATSALRSGQTHQESPSTGSSPARASDLYAFAPDPTEGEQVLAPRVPTCNEVVQQRLARLVRKKAE